MTAAEFAAFMAENVTAPEDFKPDIFHSVDGDHIEVFLSDESFKGVLVGNGLVVYRGRETGQVVGVLVEGVGRLTRGGAK